MRKILVSALLQTMLILGCVSQFFPNDAAIPFRSQYAARIQLHDAGSQQSLIGRFVPWLSAGESIAYAHEGGIVHSAEAYGDLNAAVEAMGDGVQTLTISSPTSLARDLALPAGLNIEVIKAGCIALGGHTLTIYGAFHAGQHQVFKGNGRVLGLRKVKPEWFGADPAGISDSWPAITAAWGVIAENGGVLELDGTYDCGSKGLDFSASVPNYNNSWLIRGTGQRKAVIRTKNANIGLDLGGRDNVTLENIRIYDCGTTARVGIARYRSLYGTTDGLGHYHKYYNVGVEGSYSIACLYSIGSEVNSIYNSEFINSGSGATYATGNTNFLSLAGSGRPIDGGSNTVNNFYGGWMWAQGTGVTVYAASQIVDNLNFYGTYLAGATEAAHGIVRLGDARSGAVQGKIVFDGVRFEGQKVTAIFVNAATCWGLRVVNSHFGQENGFDIHQIPHLPGYQGDGMVDVVVEGNWHSSYGVKFENGGKSNKIVIPQNVQSMSPPITITSGGQMFNSYLEAPAIDNTSQPGPGLVEVIRSDSAPYRIHYGPSTPDPAYGIPATMGSSVVNRPFGVSPASPETGQMITADNKYWGAAGKEAQTGVPFPAFFNGTSWVPMTPIAATIGSANASCRRGTIAYDENFIYFCVADDTWKRIAWPAW